MKTAVEEARQQLFGRSAPPDDFVSLDQMRKIAKWFIDKAVKAEQRVDAEGKPAPDLQWAKECLHEAASVLKGLAEYEFPKLQAVTVQHADAANEPIQFQLVVYDRQRNEKVIEHEPNGSGQTSP